jgi:hypothetical protein
MQTSDARFRIIRKSATALVTLGLAAGVLGVGWSGTAGADLAKRVGTQIATPPPPGSGVVVIVEEPPPVVVPQPIGPRSLT